MNKDEVRLGRRQVFDENPAQYQHARPGYPDEVFEILERLGALRPGADVLEIGPGGGQASQVLLDRGAQVFAVEYGENFTRHLRDRFQDRAFTVVNGDFESADVPEDAFDLAASATAFHWLQPSVAIPKLARAVKVGGYFAPWWTVYSDPERPSDFRAAVDPVYRQFLPGARRANSDPPEPLRRDDRIRDLSTGGYFGPVDSKFLRWDLTLDPFALRELYETFPTVLELRGDDRGRFLDALVEVAMNQFGGTVTLPCVTAVYWAELRRKS
jgi:SAM-dependent methyltransferase